MTYEPFLIAPYKVGLDVDMEPWLLPEDAFENIVNAHIHNGYVEKRQGFRVLAETAETNANFAITAATQADPVELTLTDVTALSNGDRIQVDYVVGMTELNGGQYLVSNKTGGAGGTIELLDLNGNNIDGTGFSAYVSGGYVSTFPGQRIMGIGRCYDDEGNRDTIVWDTARGYYFNKTTQALESLDLGDIFDSGEYDYIHWNNWASAAGTASSVLNRIYFTNGKEYNGGLNGLRFYSCAAAPTAPQAAASSSFRPTINGANTLDAVKFIFPIRQRLVLLSTIEGGTTYAQRARWCQARNPGTPGAFTNEWDDNTPGLGGFVDAPTAEHIVSARSLQDVIIVWFTNSVWTLRPTADPSLPFRWDKLNSFRGADARAGALEFDRYVLGVSNRGISITDGNETRRIDDRIEDFVTDFINGDEFGKTYCSRNYQLRRTWILYSGNEDNPEDTASNEVDGALILDDESGAWSLYQIAMNVLGHGQSGLDLQLDDFPDSPTSLNPRDLPIYLVDEDYGAGESTLQDYHWEAADELFLGGDINGFVYEMDQGVNDNGAFINFDITSAAWNPYKGQGVECELGYVDLFIDTSQNADFVVEFYKNNMDAPYKVQRVDALPEMRELTRLQDVQPLDPSTGGYTFEAHSHGLDDGQFIYMYEIDGPSFLNAQQYQIAVIDENTFEINQDFSGNGIAITAITQANPGEVTAAGHPFANGMEVVISGGDMVEVIGNRYVVANATVNTFELEGVDTTGFTAYTTGGVVFHYYQGGGVVTELPYYEGKIWKRAYGGGVGYWHQIRIYQENNNSPFRVHGFMPWFKRTGSRMI